MQKGDVNIKKYEVLLKDNIVVSGGHFMINSDGQPELNKGTIDSFKTAVRLYKIAKKKGLKTRLGLLINDIGTTCSKVAHVCKITDVFSRTNFSLPKEYQENLKNNGIKISEIELFWEKHARNRGKKIFNKFKRNHKLIKEIDNNYYLLDKNGYGLILLTRKSAQDPSGTPGCPLIMAGFNMEQEKRGYKHSLNVYYIGSDNLKNIPNYIVINKGSRVSELFGTKIKSKNIFID